MRGEKEIRLRKSDSNVSSSRKQRFLEDVSQVINKDMGVKLIPGKGWAMNGKRKEITYSEDRLLEMPLDIAFTALMHECGHFLHTQYEKDFQMETPTSANFQLLNAIEDTRINGLICGEFPGMVPKFDRLENGILDEFAPEKFHPFLQVLLAYTCLEYNRIPKFADNVPGDNARLAFQATRDFAEEAFSSGSTTEVYDLVQKNIWPILKELAKDFPQDEPNSQTAQLGNSSDDQEGEGEGGKTSVQGEPDPNATADSSSGTSKTYKKPMDFSNKETDLEKLREEHHRQMKEARVPLEFSNVGSDLSDVKRTNEWISYEEVLSELGTLPYVLSQYIGSILKDNAMDRYAGAYYNGKLSRRGLDKYFQKDLKLFQKKVERLHKDYEIAILVDESGSMDRYSKNGSMTNAFRASVLFSEALNKAGVAFSVYGFGSNFHVHKKFGDEYNGKMCRSVESMTVTDQGGTHLLNALVQSQALFSKRKDRVLFIITDGRPDRYDECKWKLEMMDSEILCFGIGIGYGMEEVRGLFRNLICVPNISELPKEIATLLKSLVYRV